MNENVHVLSPEPERHVWPATLSSVGVLGTAMYELLYQAIAGI